MSVVAIQLLEECRALRISLRPEEGGRIKVSPPPEHLPPTLRDELRQHKAELWVVLTSPHLNVRGELIIPFFSDRRYHWWAGGQSIRETLRELNAPPEILARYVESDLTVLQ